MNTDPLRLLHELDASAAKFFTPSGDGDMVWRSWGEGDPLFLYHGGYGSWIHWIRCIEPLSKHYRLYVPDLPGMGDSEMPPKPHTADGLAAVCVEGINSLIGADERPHFAGFSFGSIISGFSAAQLGERARSYTMIGAGGLGLPRVAGIDLRPRSREMTEEQKLALHRHNLGELMLANPENIDALSMHMQVTNTGRARTKSRPISGTNTLAAKLPDIKTSIAGIWGALDATAVPRLDMRRDLLRSVQPDAEFHVIPGAGHWVMYEATDVFVDTLLGRLKRVEEKE
jgi:pimeloyl-ACP methyl ester carboxylesterase